MQSDECRMQNDDAEPGRNRTATEWQNIGSLRRKLIVSRHFCLGWRLALNLDKAAGLSFPSPLVGEGRRERSERGVRGERLTIADLRLTIEMPCRQPNRQS